MIELNDVIEWIAENWNELNKIQKDFICKFIAKKQTPKQYIMENQISVEEFLKENDIN